MIYELSLFLVALIGSAIGGWIDLRPPKSGHSPCNRWRGLGFLSAHHQRAFDGNMGKCLLFDCSRLGFSCVRLHPLLHASGVRRMSSACRSRRGFFPQPLRFSARQCLRRFPAVFILNSSSSAEFYSASIFYHTCAEENRDVFPAFIKGLKSRPDQKEATGPGLARGVHTRWSALLRIFSLQLGEYFFESLSLKVILV